MTRFRNTILYYGKFTFFSSLVTFCLNVLRIRELSSDDKVYMRWCVKTNINYHFTLSLASLKTSSAFFIKV